MRYGFLALAVCLGCVHLTPMDDPRPEGATEAIIEVRADAGQVFHLQANFNEDRMLTCGGDLWVRTANSSQPCDGVTAFAIEPLFVAYPTTSAGGWIQVEGAGDGYWIRQHP